MLAPSGAKSRPLKAQTLGTLLISMKAQGIDLTRSLSESSGAIPTLVVQNRVEHFSFWSRPTARQVRPQHHPKSSASMSSRMLPHAVVNLQVKKVESSD
jgi:hypothetical protein